MKSDIFFCFVDTICADGSCVASPSSCPSYYGCPVGAVQVKNLKKIGIMKLIHSDFSVGQEHVQQVF